MIAVIVRNHQKRVVEEFFELFKVPWEFYQAGKAYEVIIATDSKSAGEILAKLKIIFSPEATSCDINEGRQIISRSGPVVLHHDRYEFPIYGGFGTFDVGGESCITSKDGELRVGFLEDRNGLLTIRVGYDLFDEIDSLLSRGQNIEYAHIPAVDVHISILRKWIAEAGICFVEIPPVPHGYQFITCLTHDVDFINIRDHGFDWSVAGFIKRALLPRSVRDTCGHIAWSRIMRNWKALLSLPGVYWGWFKDTWFDIDRYLEIENGLGTTYFFIPFKNRPGQTIAGQAPKIRAAKYDITEYRDLIDKLAAAGSEIELHGIDAWLDAKKGHQERAVIRQMTGKKCAGVRMHWLYFSDQTPRVLEEAGFYYDSTLGFNEVIGFRSGTTQVFRFSDKQTLYELPLNVMDTTLFYPDRMDLSEIEAAEHCKNLIQQFRTHGGVLTINWHTRSLSPERNWDIFYRQLLGTLRNENTLFATAAEAVHWFSRRRSIHFEDVEIRESAIRIRLRSDVLDNGTPYVLRCYLPKKGNDVVAYEDKFHSRFVDVKYNGQHEILIKY